MELVGERVRLRPVRPADLDRLREIAAEPSVARWWDQGEPDDWDTKVDADDVDAYVILIGDDVVGFAQTYEEDDPGYRHAGMDLFLSSYAQGRGLGQETVRLLMRHLVDQRGHHRLVIDPAAENAAAIRCYEACGFVPIGVARQRERAADGTWRDSLLMDWIDNPTK